MKKLLLIIIIGAAVYGFIRRDELLTWLGRQNQRFMDSAIASKKRSIDVPMIVTKLAADRGISLELANAQFTSTVANARRFRLQGKVVERLPLGHVLVRGDVWDLGHISVGNQLFALHGYPQAEKIAIDAPVECAVWLVGKSRFGRPDGTLMDFEEAVYTALPPSSTMPKDWVKDEGRTLLDKKK